MYPWADDHDYDEHQLTVWARDRLTWRSAPGGQAGAVEVARVDLPSIAQVGKMAIRNGAAPDGPALLFTGAEWAAFVRALRDGYFDPESPAARKGPDTARET